MCHHIVFLSSGLRLLPLPHERCGAPRRGRWKTVGPLRAPRWKLKRFTQVGIGHCHQNKLQYPTLDHFWRTPFLKMSWNSQLMKYYKMHPIKWWCFIWAQRLCPKVPVVQSHFAKIVRESVRTIAYLCACCADDTIASLGKIYSSSQSLDETWSVRWVQSDALGFRAVPNDKAFMVWICRKDMPNYQTQIKTHQVFRSGAEWTCLLSFHRRIVSVQLSRIDMLTSKLMTFEFIDGRSPAIPLKWLIDLNKIKDDCFRIGVNFSKLPPVGSSNSSIYVHHCCTMFIVFPSGNRWFFSGSNVLEGLYCR